MREQLEQVFSLGKGEFLVELKLLFFVKIMILFIP